MEPNGHEIPSVVKEAPDALGSGASLTLYLAHVADEIPAWGTYIRERDVKLREFFRQEPLLSSAIFNTTSRYATFEWVLKGPERQCNIIHRILHQSEHGRGWLQLMIPVVKDYLTQDNGAYIEVVRLDNDPLSPVIQLNHLDAGRCIPTGRWDEPVIYQDRYGGFHTLKYYQVIRLSEYPSPDERMRGYQECAVTRVLMDAQKIRDWKIYAREKIGGISPTSIHFVGGITKQRIEDTLAVVKDNSSNEGYLRYMAPPIITSVDQTARVSHEQVDLKSMPDGYNQEEDWREYIVLLACGIGIDPQDIAPLPGGNLGSAQQSQVLMQKGRGKGPKLFMTNMAHTMNMHGILPRTVQFNYVEQDLAEDEQQTMLRWRRTQTYRLLAGSGTAPPILDAKIIRQMMRDDGDLRQEYLDALKEPDLTPVAEVTSDDKTKSVAPSWWERLRGY